MDNDGTNTGASGSGDPSASAGAPGAGSKDTSGSSNTDQTGDKETTTEASTKTRVRNPWGIRPKEVPPEAKQTQVRLLPSISNVTPTERKNLEGIPALNQGTVWSAQAIRRPSLCD
jgi:hypothetical protein